MTFQQRTVWASLGAALLASVAWAIAAADVQKDAPQPTELSAADRAAREAAGEIETGRRAADDALSYAGWARIGEAPAPEGAATTQLRAWETLPAEAEFTPRSAVVSLLEGEASVEVEIVGPFRSEQGEPVAGADFQILLSPAAGEALGQDDEERFLVVVEPTAEAPKP